MKDITLTELAQFSICIAAEIFTLVLIDNWTYASQRLLSLVSINLLNYPYQNPPVFFSIGEALASIAILFAIYQFKRDKWLVALRVRNYIGPTVFITLILGVLLTVISSFVIKDPVYIFQLSVFWQVLGSLFILSSISILYFKARNKNLFNRRTAQKYYEVMAGELSRPSPERLDIILDSLLGNLDATCKAITQSPSSEMGRVASVILDEILGEAAVVNVLSTKRFDALHYIIVMFEKYNLKFSEARGFPQVIKNLFVDQGSFLYNHLDSNGLAVSANLFNLLFGSPKIISNFNVFDWPTFEYTMQDNLNSIQVKVFIKALSEAIEAYLKTGKINARYINTGIQHLSKILHNLCWKISTEEERGMDTKHVLKDEWWSVHLISNFLGHDYLFLAYRAPLNEIVTEIEKKAIRADFGSNLTINAGIAAAMNKAFEDLALIKSTNDTYHTAHELLHGILYEKEYREGYANPFERRMWEQIAKNVLLKYYPNALRTYLTVFSPSLTARDSGGDGWSPRQTERMRRLLFIDLKPLFDRDEKMINGKKMVDVFLPDGLKYEGGKFFYTNGFGRGATVEIMSPPVGSKSALENITPSVVSLGM